MTPPTANTPLYREPRPSLFQFRPFLNADPPALAEVWRSQPPLRGRMQPISAQLLELCVFSKQCFDPAGFIVATRDEEPVGFVHVGFGPDASGEQISTEVGAAEMLLLHGTLNEPGLADELLHRGEEHLRSRGAGRLLGGGRQPLSQFYLGLYGGAELPGVLASDAQQNELFRRNGYTAVREVAILHRDLVSFRPPMSRDARRLRREVEVRFTSGGATGTWWEASQHSEQEVFRFELINRADGAVLSRVACWDVEPLASSWGAVTVGLIDLRTDPAHQRRGLATYLLAEAFREIRVRGASLVEVHIDVDNEPAMAMAAKLGMTRIDGGRVYELPVDAPR